MPAATQQLLFMMADGALRPLRNVLSVQRHEGVWHVSLEDGSSVEVPTRQVDMLWRSARGGLLIDAMRSAAVGIPEDELQQIAAMFAGGGDAYS